MQPPAAGHEQPGRQRLWRLAVTQLAELEQTDPKLYSRWFSTPHLVRFPDGESLQDLVLRAADALRFVLQRHPEETVILVAHDSLNRALLIQLLDQPLSSFWRLAQEPCCINEIDVADGCVRVLRVNETRHLTQGTT